MGFIGCICDANKHSQKRSIHILNSNTSKQYVTIIIQKPNKLIYILIEVDQEIRLVDHKKLQRRPPQIIPPQLQLLQLRQRQLEVIQNLEVVAAVPMGVATLHLVHVGSMRLTHIKTVISHKLCTHFWSSKLSHKKEKKDKTECFTHRFSK